MLVAQLLSAIPWTAAHQAPLSRRFFQARILEWGAIAFSAFIFYSNPNHKAYMRQSVNVRIMETILRCIKQIRNLWAIIVAL